MFLLCKNIFRKWFSDIFVQKCTWHKHVNLTNFCCEGCFGSCSLVPLTETNAKLNSVGPLRLDLVYRHMRNLPSSPPARWGLLDFMSVAASSCLPPPPPAFRILLPSASCRLLPRPPRPPRHPRPPRRPRRPRPTATRDPQCSLPDLNHDHPRPVFPAGPQPRPSTPSVPCRTSTTTIPAQCSLPDLNHDHPLPVFPAGPQPRVSTPSVPCRTSCRKIWDKECAEES